MIPELRIKLSRRLEQRIKAAARAAGKSVSEVLTPLLEFEFGVGDGDGDAPPVASAPGQPGPERK